MKKLFTSLILLAVGVMVAQATVKVGGSLPNASTGAFTVSSGSAVLSGSTLTLTNAVINAGSNPGIESDVDGLTIVIKGNCEITGTNRGLYLKNNTTLRTSTASTLTIDNSTQSVYGAIKVENGATLLAEWLHIDIKAQMYGFSGLGNETLKLQCCEVKINLTSPGSTHSCIYGFSSFGTNANYWANGESYNTSKKELYIGSALATSCSLKPELTIGKFIVNTHNSYTFDGGSDGGLTAGSIKYDNSSKTLTFDNATFKSPGNTPVVTNNYVDGLTIKLTGKNTLSLTATNSGSCIQIHKPTTISGEGYTSTYKNTLTAFLPLYMAGGNQLTIDNAYLVLNGTNYGISGSSSNNSSNKTLTINKSYVEIYNSNEFNMATIKDFHACVLTDCEVNASKCPNICFRASAKGFADMSGTLTKKSVYISVPSTWYDVYVLGKKLNSLNASNVAVDGLTSGKISWDNSTQKLTLNQVTLTAPDDNTEQGIKMKPSTNVSEIVLEGENSITTVGDAIRIYGDGTISGSGELYATSTSEGALSMFAANSKASLTLNCKTVKAKGKRFGFWGNSQSCTSNLILKNGNGKAWYVFNGETASVGYATDIQMPTGVKGIDFYKDNVKGTAGCYFDDRYVRQNGGSIVKGSDVICGYIDYDYGITVAGVPVTDCNKEGIGSKYITSGGATAVTYNNSTNTLTLDGATITIPSDGGNAIRFRGNDAMTLNVTGNCNLNSSSIYSSVIYFNYVKEGLNGTIKGSGKLTVSNDATTNNIIAPSQGTLILDNIDMEVSNNIVGWTDNKSELLVRLTTSGKKITVNGTVSTLKSVVLDEGTMITEPSSATFSSSKHGIVNSSGNLASPVVFVDYETAGIDGIETDANAEVIGIFDAQGRQLNEMQPGLNIIRMSDGTSRKVMVK